MKVVLYFAGFLLLVIPVFNRAEKICNWYHGRKDRERAAMTSSNGGAVVEMEGDKADSEVKIDIEDSGDDVFGGKVFKSVPIDIPARSARVNV